MSSSCTFLQHGFALWTNYWYAGRYTFVGYSVLYYPLAALRRIRLLAVLSVAASTAAFTLVIRQTWGDSTVWATRFFALVAAASVVSRRIPLRARPCARAHRPRRARPPPPRAVRRARRADPRGEPARVPLPAPRAGGRRVRTRQETAKPAAIAASICALGLFVWRLFPDHGRLPFATSELLAGALAFCGLGAGLTWRVERRPGSCTRSSRSLWPTPPFACSPT